MKRAMPRGEETMKSQARWSKARLQMLPATKPATLPSPKSWYRDRMRYSSSRTLRSSAWRAWETL